MPPPRALRWMAVLPLFLCSPPAHAQETARETIQLLIRIDPIFHLETDSKQAGNIELGPIGPDEQQALDTARVIVSSNQERRWRILMGLEQALLSERGFGLEDGVLFSVSDGANGGRSEVRSPQPLTTTPVVIFTHDQGKSDRFTISFFSSASPEELTAAGNYSARVVIREELL